MINYLWENLFRTNSEQLKIRLALKDCPIFKDLNPRDMKLVENLIHVRSFQTGEVVFNEGQLGFGMYIILSGQVNIYTKQTNTDESSFVTRLIEGDFMGELSLIEEGSRRTATAICHGPCQLIGFFKPDLIEIMDRSPHIATHILFRLSEVLGKRLKETTQKITSLRSEIHELHFLNQEELNAQRKSS